MKNRIICSIIIGIFLCQITAFADVLGTHTFTDSMEIAPGTTLYSNIFYDSSVGNQTEHYIEYLPNIYAEPVLTNGYSAYGRRTLSQAAEILKDQGLNPAGGINADFFSFKTGVPMGNTIIGGRIFTADSSYQPGIGFTYDNEAFTGDMQVVTTATTDTGESFTIECINKYRQPYALYLFNRDYLESTQSPDKGIDIILGDISSDKLTPGGSITATVESILETEGSVPIPDDKMILSVSETASDELKGRLSCLDVGTRLTINTEINGNENWYNTNYGLSCIGGRLITDGKLDYTDEAAAPRTAAGIRDDGTVIFYTIDGRQKGYSYGVRKETLARRLLELGCVDAINLDGGGSTSIGITYPVTQAFKVMNSPSDGDLRSCANFLFIMRTAEPDGIPYRLLLDNNNSFMLSGSSASVAVSSAYDKSFGYADVPSDITYEIIDDCDTPDKTGHGSYVNNEGWLTVHGNGDVYIEATSGDVAGTAHIVSVATPDSVEIYNADQGYPIKSLVVEPYSEIKLDALSKWNGTTLLSDSSCYKWTLTSDNESVGSVSQDGYFTASGESGATGDLIVSAGICSTEIPVLILGTSDEKDEIYPSIDFKASSTDASATFVSVTKISKNNIRITCDSQDIDFDYNENQSKATFTLPDTKYHRVGIFVTDKYGLSAMKISDTTALPSAKVAFPDTKGHWANPYISYLSDHKVVNGSLDGDTIMFRPNSNMTRSEFAIMLCNYLKVNPDDYSNVTLPFTDNDDIPFWAENSVKAVYSMKLMQGQLGQYGVAFSPNDNIKRLEFAISLGRLLPDGLESKPVEFSDKDDIPFWASDSMKIICTQKIMNGYPDGTIKPLNNVTRAEAAKMLYNIFGA